ncbi:primosomal protein N' [Candidatus Riesia pediculischaeffi]|uniref:Replication restart protein PriA n=1 Tax=Candidatus Riesia pediculischaeffi PTSU TaxID=1401651 RepID=A0A0C1VJP7_9ENTR|nr:primosomal protein N' [Candidatus Riesia pediculischaeffi]KIE64085.1 Helicase PriA essential for oriC/DnaA-independent DNA replication [Candidatus Riesia pediculischaeffi PTSU]
MITIIQVVFYKEVTFPLEYILPNGMFLPKKGCRVLVPIKKRKVIGIVWSCKKKNTVRYNKLKSIYKILDNEPLFSKDMWKLLCLASQYYHHPIGSVLFNALPNILRREKSFPVKIFSYWKITDSGMIFESNRLKRYPQQKRALTILQSKIAISSDEVKKLSINIYSLKSLKKKKLVQLSKSSNNEVFWRNNIEVSEKKPKLNLEQSEIIKKITSDKTLVPWLLVGITGSGKTEVYLRIIENILISGKQTLMLVPEISLTPQTTRRFYERFNVPIEVLHSSLNNREKFFIWERSKNGENAIIIGTRSALFTNFKNLGLIIVDEEHDSSYKQQHGWCYHARNMAIWRAKQENIPIIMGTATPSLESLFNVEIGKYRRIDLTRRPEGYLPSHHIFDLKGRPSTCNLSRSLIHSIKNQVSQNNQVMLFLNRRGYSPVLICHKCGLVSECLRCEHYYTLHRNQKKIECHYCNQSFPIPIQCSKCSSTDLISLGFGTEKLEERIRQIFPNIPVVRIDKDTVKNTYLLKEKLSLINTKEAKILIGTQMLAKGHHFSNVTLVALIDIDGVFFSNDYRASEKFAQLFTQVSGRAGRSLKKGKVILQTHHPNHPVLSSLIKKGYIEFALEILKERKESLLPPYSSHIIIRSRDRNGSNSLNFLTEVRKIILKHMDNTNLYLSNPIPSTIPKKKGFFRWFLLIQHSSKIFLNIMLSKMIKKIQNIPEGKNVRWNIDVDPIEH